MNYHHLLHPQYAVSLAALVFALPVSLGAQTTISQTDIDDTTSAYWDSTNTLWSLNGGASYANSGDLNFGTTSSGDNLAIGYSTTNNSLTISSGEVTDYYGYLGYSAGSSGTVTVTGAGSTWTNSSELYVGRSGNGTLNIEDSGVVTNTSCYIANGGASSGTVTVKDAGSRWTNSGTLYIGCSDTGTGTLNIENGGTVTNVLSQIGRFSKSSGAVTVTGAGSTWTSTSYLHVGRYGTGTLTIENGGTVSNTAIGIIGYLAGSVGTVTVTGTGSRWTNINELYVGAAGTGTLTIEDGALVTATDLSIGHVVARAKFTSTAATLRYPAPVRATTTPCLVTLPAEQACMLGMAQPASTF